MDALDNANQSLYGPAQQESLSPWRQKMPFSMDPGSTYQGSAQGQDQSQSGGLMSAIGPMIGSMFAPNQGGQQQAPQPAPTPTVQPMQYDFGGGEDDTARENKANADRIGQGVLAASQAAAKSGGGMGMKKKKQGDTGDAGVGATPGSEGY